MKVINAQPGTALVTYSAEKMRHTIELISHRLLGPVVHTTVEVWNINIRKQVVCCRGGTKIWAGRCSLMRLNHSLSQLYKWRGLSNEKARQLQIRRGEKKVWLPTSLKNWFQKNKIELYKNQTQKSVDSYSTIKKQILKCMPAELCQIKHSYWAGKKAFYRKSQMSTFISSISLCWKKIKKLFNCNLNISPDWLWLSRLKHTRAMHVCPYTWDWYHQ